MPTSFELPLTMLVARFRFDAVERGELFGFWYFATCELPYGRDGRAGFFGDLLNGRCCQATVSGSAQQIREILQVGAALSDDPEAGTTAVGRAIDLATQSPGAWWEFEDLAAPQGSSFPVDLMARVTGDAQRLVSRLRAGADEVELALDPEWSPQSDLLEGLDAALAGD